MQLLCIGDMDKTRWSPDYHDLWGLENITFAPFPQNNSVEECIELIKKFRNQNPDGWVWFQGATHREDAKKVIAYFKRKTQLFTFPKPDKIKEWQDAVTHTTILRRG